MSYRSKISLQEKTSQNFGGEKNPSKFELEDIEVDEIRDYKKMIITKAHHGSEQS